MDDPRRTTKLFLIETHYEKLADDLEWNAERFRRLAQALGLTVHELGALCRLRLHQTESYMKSDSFPPPVELHLTIISRTIFPSSRPPVFPDLQLPEDSQ